MKLGQTSLGISVNADWPLSVSLKANGDDALGRGARGPIPLQLIYESRDLQLSPGKPVRWRLILKLE
jgi:hypothetical protein